MADKLAVLTELMIAYEAGVPQRVHHFLKVHSFCQMIGRAEALCPETQEIVEVAALVHDVGIKPSLEKYGSEDGFHQQEEGPAYAEEMLQKVGYSHQVIDRVCYLVAHHHTYDKIDGMDYQVLVEADFLVNMLEGDMKLPQILSVKAKIFKTPTGISFLNHMYLNR